MAKNTIGRSGSSHLRLELQTPRVKSSSSKKPSGPKPVKIRAEQGDK